MNLDPYIVGDVLVDPDAGTIRVHQETVSLPPRVMDLLQYFCSNVGVTITMDEILRDVWKGTVVSESSVYWSISQLRKALGDDSKEPKFLANVPRKGYRFLLAPQPAPASNFTDILQVEPSRPAEVPTPRRTLPPHVLVGFVVARCTLRSLEDSLSFVLVL